MVRTAAVNIQHTDRQRRALELRREGRNYDEIAAEMGIAAPSAHRLVSSALKALVAEPARDVQRLEVERLDTLLSAVWPLATAGELPAIDRALRIAERRARLLGLDGRVIAPPNLPRTLTAAVAARTPADGDGDGKPDPRREAIARLDALAELAWPAAAAGDLAALGRLVDIATARARLTGADQAPPESAQPDSVKALVAVLAKARAAPSGPLPESEPAASSIDGP